MSFKNLNLPPRISGNFLDDPVERGQVGLRWYQLFEQIGDNFSNNFDNSGNLILQRYATVDRPDNPITDLVIIDQTLNLPIWFDGTNWRNFAGVIV